jgi:hypothetical protein
MHVRVLGSGDAFGSGGRLNTCFVVHRGASSFLIDCGASGADMAAATDDDDASDERFLHMRKFRKRGGAAAAISFLHRTTSKR